MSETVTNPVVTTTQGAIPQTPLALLTRLIEAATALAPGLTASLPASLIEDMSSTATGALIQIDQAQVDAINSLTPFGANPFTILALGQIYLGQGSTAAPATNTSVFINCVGVAGFLIQPGFLVSDGTNQFAVVDGGVINSLGQSAPIFCRALTPGSFPVPANTVTQVVTSVPAPFFIGCTNPLQGTPGGAAQTSAQYAAQVLQAGLVGATGMPRYLRTKLEQVVGVDPRLISVRAQPPEGWEVIVGGTADPYDVGAAIYFGLFDVSSLVGSSIRVTGITNANPGVVTTDLNHGYLTGYVVVINGVVGMSGINGVSLTITVIDEKRFSTGTNTTSSGTWTSGGVVTPNFRNATADINSYPDTYTIPFVIPPAQTVTMTLTWNTISPFFVSAVAVAALGQPALASYVNSIPVGAPINVFEMQDVFTQAIKHIVDPVLVTRMVFEVTINTIVTAPSSGTEAIRGDPESYFSIAAADIEIIQG